VFPETGYVDADWSDYRIVSKPLANGTRHTVLNADHNARILVAGNGKAMEEPDQTLDVLNFERQQ
jgi:hypothetical protein